MYLPSSVVNWQNITCAPNLFLAQLCTAVNKTGESSCPSNLTHLCTYNLLVLFLSYAIGIWSSTKIKTMSKLFVNLWCLMCWTQVNRYPVKFYMSEEKNKQENHKLNNMLPKSLKIQQEYNRQLE